MHRRCHLITQFLFTTSCRGGAYLQVREMRPPPVTAAAAAAAVATPPASGSRPRRGCSTSQHGSGEGGKRGKSRRQRPLSDLRTLPGVGVKNEQLLVSKGIDSLDYLRSLYVAQFKEQDDDLRAFLQNEVGIRKQFCSSIVAHLSKEGEVAENSAPKPHGRGRITLSVEGNISSGKTTFLKWLMEEPLQVAGMCQVVPEPVERWQKIGGNPEYNLLERFYGDHAKYAYEFQNYVFLTRLQMNWETWSGKKPLRILERSVLSDRLVFVRAVHEARKLTDMQLELYDSWYHPFLNDIPGLLPDGFIYLRADPSTCMRRLTQRGRKEENTVKEEYVMELHDKHEDWFSIAGKGTSVQKADAQPLHPEFELPSCLKDSVRMLGDTKLFQEGLPSSIKFPQGVMQRMNKIPALVLDCNTDIDVVNDMKAKRHYTEQVVAYYNFVKDLRKQRESFFWKNEGDGELGSMASAALHMRQAAIAGGHPSSKLVRN